MKTSANPCVWTAVAIVIAYGILSYNNTQAVEMNVDGIIGLHPVDETTCAAVWIPIPDDKALAGIVWYNNDELSVFPEILLESGTPNDPVDFLDCRVVAVDVQGESSGWSTVEFDEVAGCLSEGLYVLFRFPEGSEYIAEGYGGGAALGYSSSGEGCTGWISAEGDDWISFIGNFGFAVEPIFVDASEATIVMQGISGRNRDLRKGHQTTLFSPAPNPSNPGTFIRFSVASPGPIKLRIYDIRGRQVRTLVDEVVTAGMQETYWDGRDLEGRGLASGVYFARLETSSGAQTQKLLLLR